MKVRTKDKIKNPRMIIIALKRCGYINSAQERFKGEKVKEDEKETEHS